jgi:hypothetical protein
MKTLLLFVLLFVTTLAQAKQLAWDPNPVTDNVTFYRIYTTANQGVYTFGGTTSPNFFGSTPGTQTSFVLPVTFNPTVKTWAVLTATNGVLESPPSNEIQIASGAPSAPANVRVIP